MSYCYISEMALTMIILCGGGYFRNFVKFEGYLRNFPNNKMHIYLVTGSVSFGLSRVQCSNDLEFLFAGSEMTKHQPKRIRIGRSREVLESGILDSGCVMLFVILNTTDT